MEPERLITESSSNHFLESHESAAADEKNVAGVDWEKLLVRMLAAALWRNVCNGSFKDLQQRLLHTLAGDVARDRRVLILATNLVDLVNINDALLCAFDVAVRGLQQLQNDVLDVFTDVARFSQRRCVDDREWN